MILERIRFFKACGINLSLILFVSRDFHVYIPQTQEQFVDDLQKSIRKYNVSKQ